MLSKCDMTYRGAWHACRDLRSYIRIVNYVGNCTRGRLRVAWGIASYIAIGRHKLMDKIILACISFLW